MDVYLRATRQARGMTQAQLSKRSRVAQNTISRLERDRLANPTLAIVVALATALGVQPMDLRFGLPASPRRRFRGRKAEALA